MHPDWIALLSAFIAAEVRFLVVGAAAVAWHGHLRSTADVARHFSLGRSRDARTVSIARLWAGFDWRPA